MKNKNEIITNGSRPRHGQHDPSQRYATSQAIVEVKFGDSNLMVNIGPWGIKYCSWFFIAR